MHSSTSASSSSKIEESPPLSERFSFVARAARRQLYRENKTFFMFCPSDGDREIKINASWLRKGLVINAKSESGVLALSCIFATITRGEREERTPQRDMRGGAMQLQSHEQGRIFVIVPCGIAVEDSLESCFPSRCYHCSRLITPFEAFTNWIPRTRAFSKCRKLRFSSRSLNDVRCRILMIHFPYSIGSFRFKLSVCIANFLLLLLFSLRNPFGLHRSPSTCWFMQIVVPNEALTPSISNHQSVLRVEINCSDSHRLMGFYFLLNFHQ